MQFHANSRRAAARLFEGNGIERFLQFPGAAAVTPAAPIYLAQQCASDP